MIIPIFDAPRESGVKDFLRPCWKLFGGYLGIAFLLPDTLMLKVLSLWLRALVCPGGSRVTVSVALSRGPRARDGFSSRFPTVDFSSAMH